MLVRLFLLGSNFKLDIMATQIYLWLDTEGQNNLLKSMMTLGKRKGGANVLLRVPD